MYALEKRAQADPFPDVYQETAIKRQRLCIAVNSDSPLLALAEHRDPRNLRAVLRDL